MTAPSAEIRGTEPAGRAVVVTGASGGLGRAVVAHLLSRECTVAALDVGFSGWPDDLPRSLFLHEVDVANGASVEAGVRTAMEWMDRCDSVVSCAAIVDSVHRAESFAAAEWDRNIEVNLTGAFRLAQAVFPYLKDSGDGRIVFVSSVAALSGQPAQAPYAASKAGLLGLMKTLAVEWGRLGIRCNVVVPGMIATPKVAALPEALQHRLAERIPLGRFASPAEVAGCIAFLLSPAAASMNGAVVQVDGGFGLNDIALVGH